MLSLDYQAGLRRHGIRISISGKENCFDNASIKTLFRQMRNICMQSKPVSRSAPMAKTSEPGSNYPSAKRPFHSRRHSRWWAMRGHMRTELPLAAMMMAAQRQRPASSATRIAVAICRRRLCWLSGGHWRETLNKPHRQLLRQSPDRELLPRLSRPNSCINTNGRPKPRHGRRCSDTSRAITTDTACTRP